MKIEDIESRELLPGTEVRLVHTDRMTIAHWKFDPSIDLPDYRRLLPGPRRLPLERLNV